MSISFPQNWKIFPCHPGTKEPIHKGWPEIATDDTEQLEAWAAEYPDCNWAVAMGPSGLCALDPDGPVGAESLFNFQLENGFLPPTREHTTPRGGRHLIFNDPDHTLRNSVGKLGTKLDTRGGNGYIVIPPSTFDGVPYEVSEELAVADLPDWVPVVLGRARERVASADTALDRPSALSRATKYLTDAVARGDVAVEGQGGDGKTYATCAEVLNLGLSNHKALELVSKIWNVACIPPWDEEDLRVKIENASLYAQNEAGAWAVSPVHELLPPDALDKLKAEWDASAPPARETRAARFAWMDEDEFVNMPPPEWLLKDIFTRDSIAMLYGPSGHYKSFIAMNLGAEVAQTGDCAFYVAAEGIARMARKDYPAWKAAYGEDRKLPFYLVEDMPLADQEADYVEFANSIKAKAAGRNVGIIFIDTLNRAMLGLEENSAKDTARVIQACLFLKKVFKCTVVVVHHTPKDGSDPRGSSALYAGFDTVLKVIADKAVKVVRMFVTKQKTDEERAAPFCYEGKRYGAGLAFTPIDLKDASAMSADADIYSPKAISAALVKLKAFLPNNVSSHVLLGHIVPQLENETDQQRQDSLARASKGLQAAVKAKRLDGYHEGEGRSLRWSLPSPDPQ